MVFGIRMVVHETTHKLINEERKYSWQQLF